MTVSETAIPTLLRQAQLSYKHAVIYFHRLRFYGITHHHLQSLQEAINTLEHFVKESSVGIAEIELKNTLQEGVSWASRLRKYYYRMLESNFSDEQSFPEQKLSRAKYDVQLMIQLLRELIYMATRFQDSLTEVGMSPVLIDDGMALLTDLKRRCKIWDHGVEENLHNVEDIEAEIQIACDFTSRISRAGQSAFRNEPALLNLFQFPEYSQA